MAKNKKGKVIQMLTPEKYIKSKARTLPVFECHLNTDWKDTQMAHAMVARKHSNGNITVCIYLIDLLCLGVKDTSFLFNITETNYREQIDNVKEQMEFELCEYALIHNIVYSGLEFAGEFGFKPHKDFTLVTQFMLEEDDDETEYMDIECGEEGKPVYVKGPFDSETKANKILLQLEKTAGQGNFGFVDDLDEDLDDLWDENINENDLDFENKYDKISIAEKLVLFKNQMNRLEKLTEDEKSDFEDLVESTINQYINRDKADEIYDIYSEILDEYEITDEITGEILDTNNLTSKEIASLKTQFRGVYDQLIKYSPNAEKQLKSLVKKHPENASVGFLQLTFLRLNNEIEYRAKIKEYNLIYPGYSLIRLLNQIDKVKTEIPYTNGFAIDTVIETYFPGRKVLHQIEIFHVFLYLFVHATRTKNLELLDALDFLIEESYLQDQEIELLEYFVTMGKLEFILSLLEEEDKN